MLCTIYDYETLGKDPQNLPILSVAIMQFNMDRFVSDPYSYETLVNTAAEYKFAVAPQVEKLHRKIDMDTVNWWQGQDADIRDRYFKPSELDISVEMLYNIINEGCKGSEFVFTRGNTFDPIITESFMTALGKPRPYDWWRDRDTRSYIEGLSFGSGLKNSYIPEGLEAKFKAHDARHDIAMDVMRIQTLVQAIS